MEDPTLRGRAELRWSDAVNADLRKKGIQMTVAIDRSIWRDASQQEERHN